MKYTLALICILSILLLNACRSDNPPSTEGGGNSQLTTSPSTVPTETEGSTVVPTETEEPTAPVETQMPSSPVETEIPTMPNEQTEPSETSPMEGQLMVYNILFSDKNSWYNKALSCQYSSPTQLSLKKVFSCGFAEESSKPSDAEWAQLKDIPGFDINLDLLRLPADKMNQVLQEYFGITLDDVDETGFNGLTFLESTNCYYFMATDAMIVEYFNATTVENREDGSIRVTYTTGANSTVFVVTLMPNGDGYRIQSNEQI